MRLVKFSIYYHRLLVTRVTNTPLEIHPSNVHIYLPNNIISHLIHSPTIYLQESLSGIILCSIISLDFGIYPHIPTMICYETQSSTLTFLYYYAGYNTGSSVQTGGSQTLGTLQT